jgi:hypothetical protein
VGGGFLVAGEEEDLEAFFGEVGDDFTGVRFEFVADGQEGEELLVLGEADDGGSELGVVLDVGGSRGEVDLLFLQPAEGTESQGVAGVGGAEAFAAFLQPGVDRELGLALGLCSAGHGKADGVLGRLGEGERSGWNIE